MICWICGAGSGYRAEHAEWCERVGAAVIADAGREHIPNPRGRACIRCGEDDWYARPDGYFACVPCMRARHARRRAMTR